MPTTRRRQTTEIIGILSHTARVKLERRNGSPHLYARTYLRGRRWLYNTGSSNRRDAEREAFTWYTRLLARAELAAGTIEPLPDAPASVTFADAYESFIARAETIQKVTPGQIKNYRDKWTLLQSDLAAMPLTDITTDWLEQLRARRKASTTITGVSRAGKVFTRQRTKPLSNATLKKDFDFVRLVLKHARDHDKTLSAVPTFPEFEGRVWRVVKTPRPFLPPDVWNRVKRTALARASEPGLNPRTRRQRQELYAYLMLSVGAALRPSEAYSLRWKDCALSKLGTTECVRLWVHGKHAKHADTEKRERGWALFDGVTGFKYLKKGYPNAKPDDKLFSESHTDGMRELLEASGVREDVVSGMTRDAKSLRSTGISLRLQETDPSYNDIAVWARTNPAHIAAFYDQVDLDWKVRRMAGLDEETGQQKESRLAREKLRKQMAKEAMMDNDYIMGQDTDEHAAASPSTTSGSGLRLVGRKKR